MFRTALFSVACGAAYGLKQRSEKLHALDCEARAASSPMAVLAAALFGSSAGAGASPAVAHAAASNPNESQVWGVPWVTNWDGRAADRASSSIKRQIVLIRHGQYFEKKRESNATSVLSPLGEEQARLTGAYLAQVLHDGRSQIFVADSISAVTSSDYTRAKQTADLMFGAMLDEEKLLKAGRGSNTQVQNNYRTGSGAAPAVSANAAKGADAIPILTPGSQAAKHVIHRDPLLRERYPCLPEPHGSRDTSNIEDEQIVEQAFNKYIHRPSSAVTAPQVEVIVSHANVIRYFVCRALQLPPEAWLRFSLPNCSLTHITVRGDGRVSVLGVGDAAHLPPSHQTTRNVSV